MFPIAVTELKNTQKGFLKTVLHYHKLLSHYNQETVLKYQNYLFNVFCIALHLIFIFTVRPHGFRNKAI